MTDAARIARAVDAQEILAEALANLAWVLGSVERDRARQLFDEARDLALATGRPDLDLLCRVGAGRLEVTAGNFDAAEALESAALAELEAMDDRNLLGACLGLLGDVARARGDTRTAAQLYRRFLAVPSPTPESPVLAFALASAAHTTEEIDPIVAVRLAGAASSLALKLGMEEPWSTIGFGEPRQIALKTLPPELVDAAYAEGMLLSAQEGMAMLEGVLDRISPG